MSVIDPYHQAKPHKYSFNSGNSRTKFNQTKKDSKLVGKFHLADSSIDVFKIKWTAASVANLRFLFIGENLTRAPVAEGYCKKTEVGTKEDTKLGWVFVVTNVNGEEPKKNNQVDFDVLSPDLSEALSTGISFAIWNEDLKIRLIYPELGPEGDGEASGAGGAGMAPCPQTPTDLGGAGLRPAQTHTDLGVSPSPLADLNLNKEARPSWATFSPTESFSENSIVKSIEVKNYPSGFAVEVVGKTDSAPLGLIFPLENQTDILKGLSIQRLVVLEKRIDLDSTLSSYEVGLFSDFKSKCDPVAILQLEPVVDEENLVKYTISPSVGSYWESISKKIKVDEALAKFATTEARPVCDELLASIGHSVVEMRLDMRRGLAGGSTTLAPPKSV